MVNPAPRNFLLPRNVIEKFAGPDPRTIRQVEDLFKSFNGRSPNYGWRPIAADTGIEANDFLLDIDATLAPVIIQLPTAASAEGRELVAKLTDASGNGFTLTPDGTETIDGAAALSKTVQWEYARILSNGTNWRVIG